VIIGIVRFWRISVIDLIGNLTGTSLTTFMLVPMELMLGGLCINIPMLRPFYNNWKKAHNSSHGSSHGKASYVTTDSGLFAERQGGTQGHAAWIELVSYADIRKDATTLIDYNDKENENGHDSDTGSQRKAHQVHIQRHHSHQRLDNHNQEINRCGGRYGRAHATNLFEIERS